jgi:putative inorganic carbon (HCO3(-)) transporter
MRSISGKYAWIIIPLIFLVALAFRLVLKEKSIIYISNYVLALTLGGYLLLFKKEMFMSLCIFLIPLSVGISNSALTVVAPSEPMAVLLGLAILSILITRPVFDKKILFHPITWLLVLDVVWMFVSTMYSELYTISIKRVGARAAFLFIFYLFTAQWMTKKENLLKFFLLYGAGLMIPILFTEYKHSLYAFNPKAVYELSAPLYADHTIYGACLAYVLPFAFILAINARSFQLNKRFRIFAWVLFFLLLAAEILAFSRAAWLSLVVAFLMYVFLKFKLKFVHFITLLGLAVLLLYVYQDPLYERAKRNENLSNRGEIGEHFMSVGNLNSDASNLERINRWACAYRMFEDRPITGFGPGTYQFVYSPYQSLYQMTYISTTAGDKGNAHSEPLTYLCETGLPGFILYFVWILATIAIAIRAYYRAKDNLVKNMILAALLGLTTFFFHGMVNSFIDQIKMASLVFGSIAMIVVADISTRYKVVTNET